MKKIHIAISVENIEKSIVDYNNRLGETPCVIVPSEYALWRIATINLSIRKDIKNPGKLRHLGIEEETTPKFLETKDVNGIIWEAFNEKQQDEEILYYWPHAEFKKRK